MASANCTSNNSRSYRDFIVNVKNPDARFQRVAKEPGSKELVYGKWMLVGPVDCQDENGPAQSASGGG